MSIRDWPADERPREKLLLKGAAALSDAELLAIFLRMSPSEDHLQSLKKSVCSDIQSGYIR